MTTDIRDAWLVVDELRSDDWNVHIVCPGINGGQWGACFWREAHSHYAEAETVAEAICEAARKVVGDD